MPDTTTRAAAAVSLAVPQLREMLTAVLPHAGTDDTLPTLMAVRFEVLDGALYVAATDRYTIGIARHAVPGARIAPIPDAGSRIPVESVRKLLAMLDDDRETVVLVITDDEILADAGRKTWSAPAYTDGFPDWRSVMAKLLTGEVTELGDDFAVNATLLARFSAGAAEFDPWEPTALKMRVVRGEDTAGPTVLLTQGGWFLGAIMSVRVVCATELPGALPQWDSWTAALMPPVAEVKS